LTTGIIITDANPIVKLQKLGNPRLVVLFQDLWPGGNIYTFLKWAGINPVPYPEHKDLEEYIRVNSALKETDTGDNYDKSLCRTIVISLILYRMRFVLSEKRPSAPRNNSVDVVATNLMKELDIQPADFDQISFVHNDFYMPVQ
jgi:hypothetical protein